MPSGWFKGAMPCPSPHRDVRPVGADVDLLVIHNISLPPEHFGAAEVLSFFCGELSPTAHPYYATIADLRVSAHFFITRTGILWQLVSTQERAWHAGVSCFEGKERCNDFSIGIELEGSDNCAFNLTQYQQLAKLSKRLMRVYPKITNARIVGHSDIAPGRKTDPGSHFEWPFYHQLMEALP